MFGLGKKSSDAWLLAGLGNPGDQYARNRHNIGFMAADEIASQYGFGPWKSKYKAEMAEGSIDGVKVILLKPQTYMNLSGESVASAAKFYKIPTSRVVVFYDEVELPPGKMRVKLGGGNAGHNGLKSMDEHMPDKNYWRVRLGVGRPPHQQMDLADYVLGNFNSDEMRWVKDLTKSVAKNVNLMLAGQDSEYMNKVTLDTKGN